MDDGELALVEEVIRSQLGMGGTLSIHDRTEMSPLNLFLDEVEKPVEQPFVVYWVSGGAPQVFILRGFSRTPVVISERYLGLSEFVRRAAFNSMFAGEVRTEVVEQLCLEAIAEFALGLRNVRLAVVCFLRSLLSKGTFFLDKDVLSTSGHESIDTSYMISWCFGLAHELGHVGATPFEESIRGSMFSDQALYELVDSAFDRFPELMPVKDRVMKEIVQDGSDFVLGPDQLRSEGLADYWAVHTLLRGSAKFMNINSVDEYPLSEFMAEVMIHANMMVLIDRCQRVARIATNRQPDERSNLELALHSVIAYVRATMLITILRNESARFLVQDREPTHDLLASAEERVLHINANLSEVIDDISSGLDAAMQFALVSNEDPALLIRAFASKIEERDLLVYREARQFSDRAERLGAVGSDLDSLRTAMASWR